ncbi:MAG: hypothetical protein EZS28_056407, partial [Streblomastix strix]
IIRKGSSFSPLTANVVHSLIAFADQRHIYIYDAINNDLKWINGIHMNNYITAIQLHPVLPRIACGNLNGSIQLYDTSQSIDIDDSTYQQQTKPISSSHWHSSSVTGISFISDIDPIDCIINNKHGLNTSVVLSVGSEGVLI